MDLLRYDYVDSLLQQVVYKLKQECGIVGAFVAVVKTGKQAFTLARAYGYVNEEEGEVADAAATRFDCGCLAQLVTALAVLHLCEAMDVPLDTDANSLLPEELQVDMAAFGALSLQHLLTHTSGVYTAEEAGRASLKSPRASPPRNRQPPDIQRSDLVTVPVDLGTDVMEQLQAMGPICCLDPGGKYRYAEVDAVLLAAVVESVSGQAYSEYVHAHLLSPLGIETESWEAVSVYCNNESDTHMRSRTFAPDLTPAKGLTVTADDGLKLLAALLPSAATPAATSSVPPGDASGVGSGGTAAGRVIGPDWLRRLTTEHFTDTIEETLVSCGMVSRGLGRSGVGAVWATEPRCRDDEPRGRSLLLLAPEAGFAMLVASNTNDCACTSAHGFCGQVVASVLETLRPPDRPAVLLRAVLPVLPPSRPDAVVTLVCFPPAGLSGTVVFDSWAAQLPDFIRVRTFQPPGRGSRHQEEPLRRLTQLAVAAASAIASSLAPGAPFALFGHGLGALCALETARRLQGWHQRPPLHVFVSGCASPTAYTQTSAEVASYSPWTFLMPSGSLASGAAPPPLKPAAISAAARRDLHTLVDDAMLLPYLQQCVRTARLLRGDPALLKEAVRAVRADLECEETYRYLRSAQSPVHNTSVAALMLSVATPSQVEERLGTCHLASPLTALRGEADTSVSAAQLDEWKQMTSGLFSSHTVPGDHFFLDDRRGAALLGLIPQTLARQLTTYASWLPLERPGRKAPPASPVPGVRSPGGWI